MTPYRLPRHICPVDYDVTLEATPHKKTFRGRMIITVNVLEPTASMELNAVGIAVHDVTVTTDSNRLSTAHVKAHPDRQTVELVFDSLAPKGRLEISLQFDGTVSHHLNGLYLSTDGADHAIVSQCEATDARAIFPCFDEPHFKATLRWTVITSTDMHVVTNGALVARSERDGLAVFEFSRTPPISSYLAAVAIGVFESTTPRVVGNTPCRILCGPGRIAQTQFALEATTHLLPWFEDYFGCAYHFSKLDQLAVPGFDAGAMENVGAIFYRQSLLLMQRDATSWFALKRIAEVIAHEIAHMWFGNLVTMEWWDDLWLNEAFATWIAFKAVDLWHPEWRMWDDSFESAQSALSADAMEHTHPIFTPVASPDEATEMFDVITYEKGCAVLRMLEKYLGEDTFRSGVRRYMKDFSEGNANRKDLWNVLSTCSDKPVAEMMESWVTQSGLPLVKVTTRTHGRDLVLHFEQKRFFASPKAMGRPNDQRWSIPLAVRFANADGVHDRQLLLRDRETTLRLSSDAPIRWTYANADGMGFYRLQLDDRTLCDVLNNGLRQLCPTERANLLDDQWALVRCGESTISRFMTVLASFRKERDFLVTRALANRLEYIDNFLARDEERPLLRDFIGWLFETQIGSLGFEPKPGESAETTVRRAAVVRLLGATTRNNQILNYAETQQLAEVQNPLSVHPDLARVWIALAAIRGDRPRFDSFVSTFLERQKGHCSPEISGRYLAALGHFEDPDAVEESLRLCLVGTVPQDQTRTVLTPLLWSRHTARRAWTFLRDNWTTLAQRMGSMGIARLVESTGSLPMELRNEVEQFFGNTPVPGAERAIQKALEQLDLRSELITRESQRLSTWLRRDAKHYKDLGED